MTKPLPHSTPWKDVPERQQQVLDFIDGSLRRGEGFPSATAIAAHMGWKQPASAADCLNRLAWRGLVKRTGGIGHGLARWEWERNPA
jgi:Mn-dependent DtxR family transcriptional regulator